MERQGIASINVCTEGELGTGNGRRGGRRGAARDGGMARLDRTAARGAWEKDDERASGSRGGSTEGMLQVGKY